MDKQVQRIKDLESVIAIVTGLIVIGFIFSENEINGKSIKIILPFIGACIGILSIISKGFTKYISLGWMKLAESMGFIISKVVLSSVFFIFLSPIAMLYKIGKGNKMNKKVETISIFIDRNHTYTKDDFDKTW